MKRYTLIKKLFPLLVVALFCHLTLYAEIAVVTHPDNPVSGLSAKEVKKIFLGKMKSFSSGESIAVIDQKDGAVRDQFYQKVVKKNQTKLKAYWSKKIFTGKGNPPPSVDGDAKVKAFLAGNKSGLGYIDGGSVDATVKVLLKVQ